MNAGEVRPSRRKPAARRTPSAQAGATPPAAQPPAPPRAEAVAADALQRVKALQDALARAEEHERRRIADQLHGTVSQSLAALAMRLTLLEAHVTAPEARQLIADLHRITQEASRTLRAVVYELRPPALYVNGLAAGLQALAATFEREHGLKVRVETPPTEPRLSEDARAVVYNAVRELLFNVVKHARATESDVTLNAHDGHLQITVRDNGTGFRVDPAASGPCSGFGLFSIQERVNLLGGSLDTHTVPGSGTTVRLTLPAPG